MQEQELSGQSTLLGHSTPLDQPMVLGQPIVPEQSTANQSVSPIKDFNHLLDKLVTKYSPLEIWCFNKITEKKQRRGCFADEHEEGLVHYYLLMVTEAVKNIENSVQNLATSHYKKGLVVILTFGKGSIEKSIANGFSFFQLVYQRGQLLYSSSGLFLNKTFDQQNIGLNMELTQQRFEMNFSRAHGFLLCAKESLLAGNLQISAFLLHQVIEQYCVALIGMNMNYRCNIHNLYRLVMLSRCFTEDLYKLFLADATDAQMFQKLIKGYTACRYRADFEISNAELEKLMGKATALLSYRQFGERASHASGKVCALQV